MKLNTMLRIALGSLVSVSITFFLLELVFRLYSDLSSIVNFITLSGIISFICSGLIIRLEREEYELPEESIYYAGKYYIVFSTLFFLIFCALSVGLNMSFYIGILLLSAAGGYIISLILVAPYVIGGFLGILTSYIIRKKFREGSVMTK